MSSLWGGLLRRFSDGPSLSWSSSTPAVSSFSAAHGFDGGTTRYYNNSKGVGGDFVPPGAIHREASPLRLPPLEPLALTGYYEDTAPEARLLTRSVAEEIRILVPARLAIVDEWNLVYSLDQDGASLSTLYQKARCYEGRRVGFVLVVKDCDGGVRFPAPASRRRQTVAPAFALMSMLTGIVVSRSLAPTSPTSRARRRNTLARGSVSSGAPPCSHPSRPAHPKTRATSTRARRRSGTPPSSTFPATTTTTTTTITWPTC